MSAKVYFKQTPDVASRKSALSEILKNVSGFEKDSFVAIKTTIGDTTARHFLKPELVREVVEKVKSDGAKPFVFDTNVLYIEGKRHNAVDHMNLAHEKGFSPDKIGAPFLIADGLFGADGKEFPVNYNQIKKIKAPSFIGTVDNVIVLSHITGHIMSSYAGAIKNVGMGMSSRAGKHVQHSTVKPNTITKKCVMCGACIKVCPTSAISKKDEKAFIDYKKCIGCGECLCACRYDAITVNWKTDVKKFCERMTEYAAGIVTKFKSTFFINFAFDVTKECDCIASVDEPIICEDVGIIASQDLVAVEKATVDLLTNKEDIFLKVQKHSLYRQQLEYAQKLSIGSLAYELIKL